MFYPKRFFLVLVRSLHGHDDEPRALAVHDVRPDLAGHIRIAETIEEIVLREINSTF